MKNRGFTGFTLLGEVFWKKGGTFNERNEGNWGRDSGF